jgi:transglutaminase-like putative cysteine protease
MKMIVCIALTLLWGRWATAAGTASPEDNQQRIASHYRLRGDTRQFSIQYTGRVTEIPAGTKRLRVWLPAPQNSSVQEISKLEFTPPAKIAHEPKYGNQIAYIEMENPEGAAEVKMSFVCKRGEIRVNLANLNEDGSDTATAFMVFKNPDKLVLVDDEMKMLSDRVTLGKSGAQAKARAIYDYVLAKMTYDKNHPGWGLGSTRHACDVGKGNCTDFHALFNSLCRAQGIASGFEIGLYLPYERNKQETLGGYHCWGFFRVPGKTWVPVDCSEADRFPERKEYFFGNHTSNRVTLSTGRDIILEPKQEGAPLNYFLNPYAEADGKPVKTEKTWAYQDVN